MTLLVHRRVLLLTRRRPGRLGRSIAWIIERLRLGRIIRPGWRRRVLSGRSGETIRPWLPDPLLCGLLCGQFRGLLRGLLRGNFSLPGGSSLCSLLLGLQFGLLCCGLLRS